MSHTTRDGYHRSLGRTVEVIHTETRLVRSVFTGPYAQERAEQRARELDEAEAADRQGDR